MSAATVTNESSEENCESEEEMPKDGRKGRKRQGILSSSDITLGDFADCAIPQACGRLRKSVVSATATGAIPKSTSAIGLVAASVVEEEELLWFEKDLEDFVISDPREEGIEEEEGGDSNKAQSKASKGGRKKQVTPRTAEKTGCSYPIDLWYVLSMYIYPEDTGRFACLCQGAHAIIQTSAFWRRLYNRCYRKKKEGLPADLKPHRLEKLHGLRSRVIRSLFILHAPLAERVTPTGPLDDEPHRLSGHRCLLVWHQPAPKGWQFCFKFQKPSLQGLTSRLASKQDVYNGYNDLFYNPEEGCCVLQVTCCHFSSVTPAVMGLLLNQVYVTLSAGFRHHRLRLHFDSRLSASHNTPSDAVIVLDDVLTLRILQWWNPGYPFSSL